MECEKKRPLHLFNPPHLISSNASITSRCEITTFPTKQVLFRTADAMCLRQQLALEVQVMVNGLDDAALGKIALASHLHSAVDELKVDFTVLCHLCTEVRHVVAKAAAPLALVFESPFLAFISSSEPASSLSLRFHTLCTFESK